jgi:HAD superfamily hydrolase (TIGR01549 family)
MRDMSKLPKPSILFFDIGNVFVSDDPSGSHVYRSVYDVVCEDRPMSYAEFFAWRERHVRAGGDMWKFAEECLGERLPAFQRAVRTEIYAYWSEKSPAIPGMAEAAHGLAEHYRLGIIANQPPQLEDVLRERGMWDLFEVRAISDVLGMAKPDPRLFQWALGRAGVKPGESIMIGDRLDNDIRPAKALGMQTLWIRFPFESRAWEPETDFQHAYVKSMKTISPWTRQPTSDANTPDYIAESPEELVRILTR